MNELYQQVRVAGALLGKELILCRRSLRAKLINSAIVVAFQSLSIGYFLPLMGMPQALIGPFFIVAIGQILFSLGFNMSLSMVLDLQSKRAIEYYFTLPFSWNLLMAVQVATYLIETLIISLPVLFLGILILGSSVTIAQANWIEFVLVYHMFLLFMALFFITVSIRYSSTWFFDNVWPRRLAPLFFLSASFFSWQGVHTFSPVLAYLFLFNPMTYAFEGIRASLFGSSGYLSWYLCMGMLVFFSILSWIALRKTVIKRLDPVG